MFGQAVAADAVPTARMSRLDAGGVVTFAKIDVERIRISRLSDELDQLDAGDVDPGRPAR